MKKSIAISIFLISVFFAACNEKITDILQDHKAPDTHLFLMPDDQVSQQPSKLKIHWWGDAPDGLVIGYYFCWNGTDWTFTTRNDSAIAFPLKGLDTSYAFQVASVNGYGNGKWDEHVYFKPGGENSQSATIDLGSEPYKDLNNNGRYDDGEIFTDIGMIDPTPAVLSLPLKNTPPEINFYKDKANKTIELPETTFTVASMGWDASDLDGDETIVKYYIALNDTAQKIEIPGTARFITLKANLNVNAATAECNVYIGTSTSVPYSKKLPNLRLNGNNKFFIYAIDLAGAKSTMLRLPESENKKWFVKKPKGDLLIIDDYETIDNSSNFYKSMMDSLGLNGKYDVLDIKYGKTDNTNGVFLPTYINPMFTETMKLFKSVIWYTDNNPSLDVAQSAVRTYTDAGGKILLSMVFPQVFDSRGLSDFLPIDQISASPINIIPRNTNVPASVNAQALNYPALKIDNGTIPVARIRTFDQLSIGAVSLYNLDVSNKPIIGFKNYSSSIIYLGLPLHRCNGGGTAKKFLNKVLSEEFKLY